MSVMRASLVFAAMVLLATVYGSAGVTITIVVFSAIAALGLWTWRVTRDFPWWTDSTEGSNTE